VCNLTEDAYYSNLFYRTKLQDPALSGARVAPTSHAVAATFCLFLSFHFFEFLLSFLFNRVYVIADRKLKITTVYPKISGLAAWSENCNWYSSLPLGAVKSLFCESV
jgi:hypothetical protein